VEFARVRSGLAHFSTQKEVDTPVNQPDRHAQLDMFAATADRREDRNSTDPKRGQTSAPGSRPRDDDVTPVCLTAEQAARYLGISRAKVYELLGEHAFRSFTIGRSRRIPISELDAFIADRLQ
jgi:excisionase family DNA binding protein